MLSHSHNRQPENLFSKFVSSIASVVFWYSAPKAEVKPPSPEVLAAQAKLAVFQQHSLEAGSNPNKKLAIKELSSDIAELLKFTGENYRIFWSRRVNECHQIGEKTMAPFRTLVSKLTDLLTQTHQLNETESKELSSALLRFEYGLSHTFQRSWETTAEDIAIVCHNPRNAKKITEAIFWLNNNCITFQSNKRRLKNLTWTNQKDLEALFQVNVREYSQDKNFCVPHEIKAHLFFEMLHDSSPLAILKNKEETMIETSNSTLLTKKFRIKQKDMKTIFEIFSSMKEEEKDDVINKIGASNFKRIFSKLRKIYHSFDTFTEIEAENLYSDISESAPVRIINMSQLYYLIRVLYAAALPSVESHWFFGGPPEGWKPPEPTPEKVIQNRIDDRNKALAKELRIQMLGKHREEALRPLWSCGKFYPVFCLEVIANLFSVPEKFAKDFSTIIEMYRNRDWSSPSLKQDLNYIIKYLELFVVAPTEDELAADNRFSSDRYEDSDGYGEPSHYTQYKKPLLNLANALLYLNQLGIDTDSNKEKVYQYAEYISVLTCLTIPADLDIGFKQKLFEKVISGINYYYYLENKPDYVDKLLSKAGKVKFFVEPKAIKSDIDQKEKGKWLSTLALDNRFNR